jgi:hypothetical protein
MAAVATMLMWFQLRSPELAEEFERLMASDRDIVRGSLDTMSDYRLTRPMDVPGQASCHTRHGERVQLRALRAEHRRLTGSRARARPGRDQLSELRTGKVSVNVAPEPGELVRWTLPPISSVSSRTIARPMPGVRALHLHERQGDGDGAGTWRDAQRVVDQVRDHLENRALGLARRGAIGPRAVW